MIMKQSDSVSNLKKEYHLAARIVAENNTKNSSVLFENRPRQCFWPNDEDCFMIKAGGYVVIDFGKELQGGLSLSVHVSNSSTLHLVFGESVSEAMSTLGEKNSLNCHSMRDYHIPVCLMTTFETGNTGFRFVKISSDKDVMFNTIQAFCTMQDLEYKGSFSCDDELLNKIWEIGAYTVHLNMQEYIWDGIKRDRLVWIGDMHPEVNTILSVFGNTPCISNSLDLAAKDLKNKKWINNLPTYSMWWLIIQYDLYMYSADTEYLNKSRQTILNITNQLVDNIHEDGSYEFEDYFVDWSSKNSEYEKSGFNSVLIIALERAIKLCEIFEEDSLSDKCSKKLSLIKSNDFDYSGNKQTTALKYLSGTLSDKTAFDILTKNGAQDLSCFMGFYVLKSLAKMNKTDAFLDIIRSYWGGQIQMGATTFWEDFDLKWLDNAARIDEIVPEGKSDVHGDNGKFCYTGFRHSLCHGWASGPTSILSRYVLGITPTKPGCTQIKINPQLGSLKFAKGTFPTPFGNVSVEHYNFNGKITTTVFAPAEIDVIADYPILRK